MKQEEKELLLADLCARLPYHVCLKVWLKDGTTEEGTLDLEHNYGDVLRDAFYYNEIIDIKPYLRPMSSMTEEEENEWCGLNTDPLLEAVKERHTRIEDLMLRVKSQYSPLDWLNAHHFDYRGLIEKGLAIAVTEENNPYEK